MLCISIIIDIHMQNNFRNPFEVDEDDTMIILDPVAPSNRPIAEQNLGFSSQVQSLPMNLPNNSAAYSQSESESSMFNPLDPSLIAGGGRALNEQEDPPLLEDIGIDIDLIKRRIVSILTLQEAKKELIESPDLSGPIIISFLLGILLLLGGKIHFSDILTGFILGNTTLYVLFNFMAKEAEITYYAITSYLGYSLLPMHVLAVIGIALSLNSTFGVLSSLALAAWSSYTAGGMISMALNRIQGKILIIYPLFLFYLSFALIIIF